MPVEPLLDLIDGPRDLDDLQPADLTRLAEEIRGFLIASVSSTGGHFGPNLGVIELTIALHRVFDSPKDTLLWDTGHQAYVHKILTGRRGAFATLRQQGGLSGYPSRAESRHDVIENSHASTALSYADGIAKAYQLQGLHDRCVVAVVGDGSLTGGMAWEALNNIAAARDRPLIIVVNDNARSYAPTIGAFADHLATLRTTQGYERFLEWGRQTLENTPGVGPPLFRTLHGMKKGLKDIVTPRGLFEDLGLKYVGPMDGHDIEAVESALRRARDFGGPVIVHCITHKGRGSKHAENDDNDRFHAINVMDPETGLPLSSPGPSWTSVFGSEMVAVGARRRDVVAITAAMLEPVGLTDFAAAYPDRVYDVGIAEQHAAASAAGLAFGGLHPVVAVYATFLNRAFDQVLMDCALHRAGVTFVLDRAGVTGPDGASHHGIWDLSVLQVVPGLAIAAPRDAAQLRLQLHEALEVDDAPTVVRFPKGTVGEDIPAVDSVGGMDVLHRSGAEDVLVVTAGPMAATGLGVATRLAAQGIGVTVVDPRWLKPVNESLAELAARHQVVATIEDNVRVSGFGSSVAQALTDAGLTVPCLVYGIPVRFLDHGKREAILAELGLTPQEISRDLIGAVARLANGRHPDAVVPGEGFTGQLAAAAD